MILRGEKDTSFRLLIEQTKALADADAKKMLVRMGLNAAMKHVDYCLSFSKGLSRSSAAELMHIQKEQAR